MSNHTLPMSAPERPWWLVAARVARRATMNFAEDRCTHMAAAISYFALFSLFPITLLAFAIFGIVLRDDEVQLRVLEEIVDQLPIEETSIEDSLRALADLGPTLTIVALAGAAWTAGALSSVVRRSVNVAFDVPRPRPLLRGKLIDYSLLPVLGLMLLGSVALTTIWRVAQARTDERLGPFGGQIAWVWDAGALAIPAALTFVAFLFLYWLLPNATVRLRYIWPGALVAALGIEVAKYGFAYYLGNFANYDVIYGSLGGVIVLLFWIYLSANILLYGAEIAAEVPHVVREEPRHGHEGATEANWRSSLLSMLRGLVLAPGEEVGPRADAPNDPPDRRGGT